MTTNDLVLYMVNIIGWGVLLFVVAPMVCYIWSRCISLGFFSAKKEVESGKPEAK